MSEEYLKLGNERFISHRFQFIIHYPIIRRYMAVWVTDSAVK
jgi:hypothetical protein